MQWFQVTCPSCTAALQVRLPEGVTSVQCSQCKAIFAVQVQPIALNMSGSAPVAKRSRKRKSGKDAGSTDPSRQLSAYNVFMKGEVAKVKSEHPELQHRDAFKLAAERWQSSPMNPQNGGERFPLKAPIEQELLPLPVEGGGSADVGGAGYAMEDGDGDDGDGEEAGDDGEEDDEQ